MSSPAEYSSRTARFILFELVFKQGTEALEIIHELDPQERTTEKSTRKGILQTNEKLPLLIIIVPSECVSAFLPLALANLSPCSSPGHPHKLPDHNRIRNLTYLSSPLDFPSLPPTLKLTANDCIRRMSVDLPILLEVLLEVNLLPNPKKTNWGMFLFIYCCSLRRNIPEAHDPFLEPTSTIRRNAKPRRLLLLQHTIMRETLPIISYLRIDIIRTIHR